MDYYISKSIDTSFENAKTRVVNELKKEGFGVVTEIDVKDTLKKKINVDFKNYAILGACNPKYAYEALTHEPKIGTMLPCNVIVQETENGETEIAAIDPIASMQAVQNENLQDLAIKVREKLQRVIQNVQHVNAGKRNNNEYML